MPHEGTRSPKFVESLHLFGSIVGREALQAHPAAKASSLQGGPYLHDFGPVARLDGVFAELLKERKHRQEVVDVRPVANMCRRFKKGVNPPGFHQSSTQSKEQKDAKGNFLSPCFRERLRDINAQSGSPIGVFVAAEESFFYRPR